MAEKWLEREVARGLQGMLALRLNGAPPEDSVTLTLDIWLEALSGQPIAWDERLDARRIQQAFRLLYSHCDRWPTPRVFMDHLPARPPLMALPPPKMTEAQRQKNLTRLRTMMAQLGKKMTPNTQE
ncbi:hypothetical protein [Craterilacuibacter sinensis]|uniref:Uncharacterized protein n=1 Tax=Craterilacuibacter sinensis TaxID=2686017 RepID=A0A845BN94_9NEIS|nr:hypothetical protein [Craterilacuibacter sinensis]MXR36734.1 hypothetical protein [Craterilacuibacter sinensis]